MGGPAGGGAAPADAEPGGALDAANPHRAEVRNLRKRLGAIARLEDIARVGAVKLNAEQRAKLKSRPAVERDLLAAEGRYAAHAAGESAAAATPEQPPAEEPPAPAEAADAADADGGDGFRVVSAPGSVKVPIFCGLFLDREARKALAARVAALLADLSAVPSRDLQWHQSAETLRRAPDRDTLHVTLAYWGGKASQQEGYESLRGTEGSRSSCRLLWIAAAPQEGVVVAAVALSAALPFQGALPHVTLRVGQEVRPVHAGEVAAAVARALGDGAPGAPAASPRRAEAAAAAAEDAAAQRPQATAAEGAAAEGGRERAEHPPARTLRCEAGGRAFTAVVAAAPPSCKRLKGTVQMVRP